MDQITLTKAELQEMSGHGYVVDRAPSRSGNPKITEVWLPEESRRAAGKVYETLYEAVQGTLREMQRDLRQKDTSARQAASPVRMHMNMAMGRPVDWTATRNAVSRIAGRLADVERFLQAGRRFKDVADGRLKRELEIYRAPLDVVLAPEQVVIEGALLEAGTAITRSGGAGERRLIVGAPLPTVIPQRVTALSFALLNAETGDRVETISAQDAKRLVSGELPGMTIHQAPNEGIAP